MKTLKEFLDEIDGSDELKAKLGEAAKSKETLNAFLKENGCEATAEEFSDAFAGKELGDGDMSRVSAGWGWGPYLKKPDPSIPSQKQNGIGPR